MTNKLADAPLKDAYVESDEEDLLDEGDEVEMGDVIHRPDGYYWVAVNGKQEFGPFKTLELALADMQSASEEAAEPGETLQEAEDELGVSDWIDPDTGELAEGLSTPRLHDE
jgi:hypothetical protein